MNSRKLRLLCLTIFAAIAAVSNVPLFGQAFYGSIVGTITDQSGAALRGAGVSLTNSGTGERLHTQAGAGGDYQFLNLVPGLYRCRGGTKRLQEGSPRECRGDGLRLSCGPTFRCRSAM